MPTRKKPAARGSPKRHAAACRASPRPAESARCRAAVARAAEHCRGSADPPPPEPLPQPLLDARRPPVAASRNPLLPGGRDALPARLRVAESGGVVRPRPGRGPLGDERGAASRSCASSCRGSCSSRRSASTTRRRSPGSPTSSASRARATHQDDRVPLRRRPSRRARRRARGASGATRAPTPTSSSARSRSSRRSSAVCDGEPGVFGWQLANEAFCAGFTSSRATSRSGRG